MTRPTVPIQHLTDNELWRLSYDAPANDNDVPDEDEGPEVMGDHSVEETDAELLDILGRLEAAS